MGRPRKILPVEPGLGTPLSDQQNNYAHVPLISSSLRQVFHPDVLSSSPIATSANSLLAALESTATPSSSNQNNNPLTSNSTAVILPNHSLPTAENGLLSPVRTAERVRAMPDPNCAFCLNDAAHNKIGRPEAMVSCFECGSSGHPSCLEFEDMRIVRIIGDYEWRCENCKKCELCRDKGEDNDMLLCDSCDRGWHRACLTPPLLTVPRGRWTCPTCQSDSTYFATPVPDNLPKKRLILHTSSIAPLKPSPSSFSSHSKKPKHRRAISDDEEDAESKAKRLSKKEKGKGRALESHYFDPAPRASSSGIKLTLELGRPLLKSGLKSMKGGSETVKKQKHDNGQFWNRVITPEPEIEGEEDEIEEDPDPYGGILKGTAADIGDRKPTVEDRKRFEAARETAETISRSSVAPYVSRPLVAPSSPAPSANLNSASTAPAFSSEEFALASAARSTRDRTIPSHLLSPAGSPSTDSAPPTPGAKLDRIPTSNIKAIRFGEFEIETWYQAPFPEEYSRVADGRLWICEFCLKYTKGEFQAGRHRLKCKTRHPPGDEIYRDGKVSVFEVDGRKNKIYCQNLCLLAKMFLDHKTLYYDVEPFLFYVMTTAEITGAKFVGYFSKEKRSPTNNVSCIMTLPVRQRKGWGNLLIDFSYLLSKKERRLGTPERPLSDLGLLSYRNYWTLVIFQYLNSITDSHNITIQEISAATALTFNDIYFILYERSLITDLTIVEVPEAPSPAGTDSAPPTPSATVIKPPKTASHRRGATASSSRRRNTHALTTTAGSSSSQPHQHDDHATPTLVIPACYRIHFDPIAVAAHVEKYRKKNYLLLRPDKLKWSPFLVTRGYGLDVPPPNLNIINGLIRNSIASGSGCKIPVIATQVNGDGGNPQELIDKDVPAGVEAGDGMELVAEDEGETEPAIEEEEQPREDDDDDDLERPTNGSPYRSNNGDIGSSSDSDDYEGQHKRRKLSQPLRTFGTTRIDSSDATSQRAIRALSRSSTQGRGRPKRTSTRLDSLQKTSSSRRRTIGDASELSDRTSDDAADAEGEAKDAEEEEKVEDVTMVDEQSASRSGHLNENGNGGRIGAGSGASTRLEVAGQESDDAD